MLTAVQNFIPVITSEAGLCLTAENWKEAKITTVSYSLEFLLCKPGFDLLKKISDFSHYVGWSGALVLNAASLVMNREGICTVKSPYNGSRIKLNSLELIELVNSLKPDAVILPKNIIQNCPQIWEIWNDCITPFLHADELQYHDVSKVHGVYFSPVSESDSEQFGRWKHLPRYVSGAYDKFAMQKLRAQGIEFIETDEPAKAALHGRVYDKSEEIDLLDKKMGLQFELIDTHCACPTCTQQFTRAYLHHLLQHTPLLCQRLLIQHNVFALAE